MSDRIEWMGKKPPISVLIVEDVDEMRHLLQIVLEGIPEVRVSGLAKNGIEARLELTRRRPQVVLLDEVLPGESSQDLFQEFKEAGVPVFLMTSMESPSHEIPEGAEGRWVKPGWKSIEEEREILKKLIFTCLK
jgi:two-component system response regulator CitB